jgi:hypothetical protein
MKDDPFKKEIDLNDPSTWPKPPTDFLNPKQQYRRCFKPEVQDVFRILSKDVSETIDLIERLHSLRNTDPTAEVLSTLKLNKKITNEQYHTELKKFNQELDKQIEEKLNRLRGNDIKHEQRKLPKPSPGNLTKPNAVKSEYDSFHERLQKIQTILDKSNSVLNKISLKTKHEGAKSLKSNHDIHHALIQFRGKLPNILQLINQFSIDVKESNLMSSPKNEIYKKRNALLEAYKDVRNKFSKITREFADNLGVPLKQVDEKENHPMNMKTKRNQPRGLH